VTGASGEQFALPAAVERLREIRRSAADDRITVISGADPLNLIGMLTSGERVRAITSTRIAFRRGVPVAVREGDYLRPLVELDSSAAANVATALAGRRRPAIVSGRIG
jgi:ATP-dependent Lhr-like helicase